MVFVLCPQIASLLELGISAEDLVRYIYPSFFH